MLQHGVRGGFRPVRQERQQGSGKRRGTGEEARREHPDSGVQVGPVLVSRQDLVPVPVEPAQNVEGFQVYAVMNHFGELLCLAERFPFENR